VISDNDAYNRLFEFIGPEELAARLDGYGLERARIVHHLGRGEHDESPAPSFELRGSGRTVSVARRVDFVVGPARTAFVGSAWVEPDGRRIDGPVDFGEKNRIELRGLQDLLVAVLRPELSDLTPPRWSSADRSELVAILGRLPSELIGQPAPALDATHKPLQAAIAAALPEHVVRVYGKGGRAYGFAVENAYVVDETSHRAVFVAATIYANDNETLNDDQYEYETLADPFIEALGRFVARSYLGSSAARSARIGGKSPKDEHDQSAE
jgi:hypothetical protein